MKGLVYQATNKTDGKIYVGQTTQGIEGRRREHEYLALGGSPLPLHTAMREQGLENFVWSVHKVIEADNYNDLRFLLLEAERQHIIETKSYDRAFGYNINGRPDADKPIRTTQPRRNLHGNVIAFDVDTAQQVGEYDAVVAIEMEYGSGAVYPKILSYENRPKTLIINRRTKIVPFYPAPDNNAISEYLRKHLAVKVAPGKIVPKIF